MKEAKPILLIRMPKRTELVHEKRIYKHLDEKFYDYHVLAVFGEKTEVVTIELFNTTKEITDEEFKILLDER